MKHKIHHNRINSRIKELRAKNTELVNRMVHLEERMGDLEYMNNAIWLLAVKEFNKTLNKEKS